MKLALLSDIHSNIQAFNACLAHAHALGASQYGILGDMVGYGASPAAVIDRVMQLHRAGAWVVQGNHDALALAPPLENTDNAKARNPIYDSARWTHQQLNSEQLAYIASLPYIQTLSHPHGQTVLVHASVRKPEDWPYVDDEASAQRCLDAAQNDPSTVRHIFCGHVHHQRLFYRGSDGKMMLHRPTAGVATPVPAHRHWVATIGSVGQPRDGKNTAAYAVFDTDALTLTFQRVAYDYTAAARAILAAGLPTVYADRLMTGT